MLGNIKIENFCFTEDTVKRVKKKSQIGRKYLQNIYLIGTCFQNMQRTQHSARKQPA